MEGKIEGRKRDRKEEKNERRKERTKERTNGQKKVYGFALLYSKLTIVSYFMPNPLYLYIKYI